jgi:hypothetical protein
MVRAAIDRRLRVEGKQGVRSRFTQTVAPSGAEPLRVLVIVDGAEAGWDRLDHGVAVCRSANSLLTVAVVPSRLATIAISSSVGLACVHLLGQMNEETEREVKARVPHDVGLTICRCDDPSASFLKDRTGQFDLVLRPGRRFDPRAAVGQLRDALTRRRHAPVPLDTAAPIGAGQALGPSGR